MGRWYTGGLAGHPRVLLLVVVVIVPEPHGHHAGRRLARAPHGVGLRNGGGGIYRGGITPICSPPPAEESVKLFSAVFVMAALTKVEPDDNLPYRIFAMHVHCKR